MVMESLGPIAPALRGGASSTSAWAALAALIAVCSSACTAPAEPASSERGEVAVGISLLTASERRVRAGQIRDAAFAHGMTQGYLLAGIADAETNMSHCWSELSWACQGPASPDCGGGPVVAGAGDGPCEMQQGGLGMFQFDAGTYDDTLRREGDRILTIDGNVAAAVDFVVAMLVRSVYIDGVDDAAQAIVWSNGVRPDNERWDPWIRTVTHYYNGCTPTASCWDSRYAYYGDTTRALFDEMGAAFWNEGSAAGAGQDFAAEYVSQSFPLASQPFELEPNTEVPGYIELRNSGNATWTPDATFLGTTLPRDGDSALAGADWVNPHRAASVDRMVGPGETGRFAFSVHAPGKIGEYSQFFNVVQEGVAWFSDQGGPLDDQLQVRVTVVAAAVAPVVEDGDEANASGRDAGRRGESEPNVEQRDAGGGSGVGHACKQSDGGDCLPEHDAGDVNSDDAGARRARDSSGGCSVAPRASGRSDIALLGACVLGLLRRRRR
jgi:hypothetical protein